MRLYGMNNLDDMHVHHNIGSLNYLFLNDIISINLYLTNSGSSII